MWRDDEPQIFRGPSVDYRVQYTYPGPGPVTSSRELFDLTIAVLALAAIFGMPQMRQAYLVGWGWGIVLMFYAIALVAVMLSVFPHELAHKFIARSHGYWAEFRRSDTWLAIGLFMSVVGFGFVAAPGAVMIRGNVTDEDNGKISAAGPLTNAIVGFSFFPITILLASFPIAEYIGMYVVFVSALLGAFNMLPIAPFDGSKVWTWNKGAYIGLLLLLLSLLVISEMRFHFLGIL